MTSSDKAVMPNIERAQTPAEWLEFQFEIDLELRKAKIKPRDMTAVETFVEAGWMTPAQANALEMNR